MQSVVAVRLITAHTQTHTSTLQFNWTGRLQDIFATVNVSLSGDSELVVVKDGTYLEKLTDVLPTFDNM